MDRMFFYMEKKNLFYTILIYLFTVILIFTFIFLVMFSCQRFSEPNVEFTDDFKHFIRNILNIKCECCRSAAIGQGLREVDQLHKLNAGAPCGSLKLYPIDTAVND